VTLPVYRGVDEFRAACDEVRRVGKLGLVPTMGALHEGHLSLIREARRHTSSVAVTIFVNPTQFGPDEDLDAYPRTLEADVAKCETAGASLIFAPAASTMYPEGSRTRVNVDGLTAALCGASRPVHFEGVATIVTKLLAVAGPCVAVFGRKDYQQFKVIERMVRDLLLPVRVIGLPTVREADGLALSSRNAYLSADERQQALAIRRALLDAMAAFSQGERRAGNLASACLAAISAAGLRADYVSIGDAESIEPFADSDLVGDRALLAIAAFAGDTRLIDNVVLGDDDSANPSDDS
jgi:pantoate--beta-alanine ligase